MPPTSSLPAAGFCNVAELSDLAPPCGMGLTGMATMHVVAPVKRSQEGGILPGRRDLGAMEEKDEGSIGRSPNLSFLCRK